jgi:hypothetical protein
MNIQIAYACSKTLKGHFFTPDESNHALALLSSLVQSDKLVPWRYILPYTIKYNRTSIGRGSFGTAHLGSGPQLCIKVTNFARLDSDLNAVRYNFLTKFVTLRIAYSNGIKHFPHQHTHHIQMSCRFMACFSGGAVRPVVARRASLSFHSSRMVTCRTMLLPFHGNCRCL